MNLSRLQYLPNQNIESMLAFTAIGIASAISSKAVDISATMELFTLSNYQFVLKRKLCEEIVQMFEWGMELEDVHELAPDSLNESLSAIHSLAMKYLRL
jgi:hypothetical protein